MKRSAPAQKCCAAIITHLTSAIATDCLNPASTHTRTAYLIAKS